MRARAPRPELPKPHLELLERVARSAAKLDAPAYLVGGCVRDWMLGRATKDLDVAVDGPVESLLKDALPGGEGVELFDRFGTARCRLPGGRVDFARTRKERYPRPGALPEVEPADIALDLFRRDFTVNAMALALGSDRVLDPYGGQRDLAAGRLRVLHELSFRDDPTRVFRAARFSARFGFPLEAGTRRLLDEAVRRGWLTLPSRERVREELLRMLEEADPAKPLSLLRRWGALDVLFPRLAWKRSTFASPDPWVRLGLLALGLGKKGRAFLESLKLERETRLALESALDVAARGASPRGEPAPVAAEILRRAFPRRPPTAFAAPLAGGAELSALGVAAGPAYGAVLGRLAERQWSGVVRTRKQALEWLKRQPEVRKAKSR